MVSSLKALNNINSFLNTTNGLMEEMKPRPDVAQLTANKDMTTILRIVRIREGEARKGDFLKALKNRKMLRYYLDFLTEKRLIELDENTHTYQLTKQGYAFLKN